MPCVCIVYLYALPVYLIIFGKRVQKKFHYVWMDRNRVCGLVNYICGSGSLHNFEDCIYGKGLSVCVLMNLHPLKRNHTWLFQFLKHHTPRYCCRFVSEFLVGENKISRKVHAVFLCRAVTM